MARFPGFLPCMLFCIIAHARAAKHHHNKIDEIQSANDIAAIFNPLYGGDSTYFHIDSLLNFADIVYGKHGLSNKPFRILQARLNAPAWVKVDIDNNGYTDIVFTGHDHDPFVGCLMDSGKNRFFLKWITRRPFQDAVLPLATQIKHQPAVLYYHYANYHSYLSDTTSIVCDTLVYRFGDFVECNAGHREYTISSINFNTSLCLGSCPDFTVSISKNRSATLQANNYNTDAEGHELKGDYATITNKHEYDDIINLLSYIEFDKLDSSYTVPWSDSPTSVLTITYNNGKTKTITDYGLLGTFGLNDLYNKLFALRFNQHWQPVPH